MKVHSKMVRSPRKVAGASETKENLRESKRGHVQLMEVAGDANQLAQPAIGVLKEVALQWASKVEMVRANAG